MRKIMMAALAAATVVPTLAVPTVASAQSAREVRESRQEVRQGQREVRKDIRRGDYKEAREDRRELREDRRELREDWRDYRRSHQSVFRRPAYVAPRGYSYRPVSVGYRFAPAYYGRNYWISDYGNYRLARPGAYQQWVRYGNDVALVDTRNGLIVSLLASFFL